MSVKGQMGLQGHGGIYQGQEEGSARQEGLWLAFGVFGGLNLVL